MWRGIRLESRAERRSTGHTPHSSQRAWLAGRRGATLLASCVAACASTLLPVQVAFGGTISGVTQFRIEWVRSVGLTEFEVPADNLVHLESTLKDYQRALEAAKLEDPGLLAPMDLVPFGTIGAVPDPKQTGTQLPPAISAGPLELRASGFSGVYSSVLGALRDRAGELRAKLEGAGSGELIAILDTTSGRLIRSYLPEAKRPAPLDGLLVNYSLVNGVAVFGAEATGGSSLPSVALQPGIEADSIPALERQIESGLESMPTLKGLDLRVGASMSDLPGGKRELVFHVGYVGPSGNPALPVSAFSLSYVDSGYKAISGTKELNLPDPQAVLAATSITLYRIKDPAIAGGIEYLTDWDPAASEGNTVKFMLNSVPSGSLLSVSAIQHVMEVTLETLRADDYELMGVFVDAAPMQLDMRAGGKDIRRNGGADGANTFELAVIPGIVGKVRVLASGERVDESERVDPPYARFDRIRERSPFQPGDESTRVLRRGPLQDFLDRMSRHPNRRVDAAVTPLSAPDQKGVASSSQDPARAAPTGDTAQDQSSAAGQAPKLVGPATIGIDYLVTETKPWTAFAQISNTGTQSTGEWQERFGFFHSDLLGGDEILSVEYVTTNFQDTHGINAYFDAPVDGSDWIRWKLLGGWNSYTASDVGSGLAEFEGESPFVGGELAFNVWQSGKLFLDVVGGVRWFDVYVNNKDVQVEGQQDFLVPYVGARLQRNARDATTDFSVFADFSLADATGVDVAEQENLGRLDPDRDWQLLRWDLYQSLYLDPLVPWSTDIRTATLAHEVAVRFRGQYSFGNRLIPQQMGVVGGLYTVRGYPESIVAGDDIMLFTGEYRLHLPQLLGFDPNPEPFLGMGEPFRLRPQFGYGATDWDLIFRAFIDIGLTTNADRKSYESDETLIGAGVGIQLQVLRNLDLRVDLGFPLQDLDSQPDIDSSRLSFVGTLAF